MDPLNLGKHKSTSGSQIYPDSRIGLNEKT
jgi:hypothetical protein